MLLHIFVQIYIFPLMIIKYIIQSNMNNCRNNLKLNDLIIKYIKEL